MDITHLYLTSLPSCLEHNLEQDTVSTSDMLYFFAFYPYMSNKCFLFPWSTIIRRLISISPLQRAATKRIHSNSLSRSKQFHLLLRELELNMSDSVP